MSVRLRLARGGAKKRPYYYIVAAHITNARDGRYIEQVGTYNPMLPKDNEQRITLNEERCKYWLSVGAKPSDRVARFLDSAGLLKREERNNPNKAKPKKKAQERVAMAEEKAKEAEEAAKAPAEAPAEEAPAAEASAE